MNDIQEILDAILKFRDDRDWEQFHNPKDLAIAINVESGELLENYLWKKSDIVDEDKVEQELADVLIYCFLLAEKYKLDIREIMLKKIEDNDQKYPVEKARGKAEKYTDL